jgi:hypothetical protein
MNRGPCNAWTRCVTLAGLGGSVVWQIGVGMNWGPHNTILGTIFYWSFPLLYSLNFFVVVIIRGHIHCWSSFKPHGQSYHWKCVWLCCLSSIFNRFHLFARDWVHRVCAARSQNTFVCLLWTGVGSYLMCPSVWTCPGGLDVFSFNFIPQVESSTELVTYRHLGNDSLFSWFVIKSSTIIFIYQWLPHRLSEVTKAWICRRLVWIIFLVVEVLIQYCRAVDSNNPL